MADWLIIMSYFVAVVWLGMRFGKRNKDSQSYFLGKGQLPGWAVGLSLFATIISSWAFLALPGKSYLADIQNLVIVLTLPFTTWLAARVFIPLFRDKIRLSAYEYLENRFGLGARVYGNLAFLVVHFGKMAAILYLLCLAISGMTGWNIFVLIAIIGVATIAYTTFGGIEGVVWTDVIQGLLLLSGGVISLGFLLFSHDAGPAGIMTHAAEAGKFKLVNWSFDPAKVNAWVFAIFGLNFYFQKFGTDQTVVQRYLLSNSEQRAKKALWMGSSIILFVWALFLSIGALLWAYFDLNPGVLPEDLAGQPDKIYPFFIGYALPPGITGLILTGLIAATMSTLSSDLNCLAAVIYEDYYLKLRPQVTEAASLFFSRTVVLAAGLLSVGLAMWMTRIHSMADAAFNFVSLVAGGVLGMYLLGMLSRRAHARGLYLGLAVGIAFILWASFTHPRASVSIDWIPRFPFHTLWIGLFGNLVVFLVGWLASRVLPAAPGPSPEPEASTFSSTSEP